MKPIMEMLTLKIPLHFIEAKLGKPTWRDAVFGLENQLLDPNAVVRLAAERLDLPDPPAALVDLAVADSGAPVLEDVRQLAEQEDGEDDAASSRRWLYLVLAWLFEHRDELPDPLQSVEVVYAEFDYPEEVAEFVRYMPTDGPDLGDRDKNEARLVSKWERYLEETHKRLAGG